jgi:hypothetical protein
MMKHLRIPKWCLVFAVFFVLGISGAAFADVVALWNYNTEPSVNGSQNYTTSQGDQFPNADVGTGTQSNVGTMGWGYNNALFPTTGAGDYTVDPATGVNDVRYRAANQAAGEGLQWSVSTIGYQNIQVQLGVFTTNNVNSTFSFDYSTDGGATWNETTTASYPGGSSPAAWGTFTLPTGAAADNLANLLFRFTLDTASSDQTITYDYVQVTGSPVPIPAAAWLLGSGLVGMLGLRRKLSKNV